MNLPPSLSQWGGYLNIFPNEVSLALGPIIQRVSMLIGSLHPQLNQREGEPDGFDGLNRRGTYERLLLSEWMLADELEDEFMRRAVMGEHLFLNRAHSSPTGTRASLALFDAGPSQLGSPRIAHIAALIVLANRADSAGSTFSWGVLQQPDTPIYRDVNATNLMTLLGARGPFEAAVPQIQKTSASTYTGSSLLFDMTGTKLYTRTAKTSVTAFNVPNSPRAGAGRPKTYHTRRWQLICAAGRVGRTIALLSAEDRVVHLEYCKQAPIKLRPGIYTGYNNNEFFKASADDGPLTPCFSLPWEGEMAALDGAGSLFRFSPLKGKVKLVGSRVVSGTVQLIATDVLAVNIVNGFLVYVGREWPDNEFRIVAIGKEISRRRGLEKKPLRAFFGPPSRFPHKEVPHSQFGLLALEQAASQWVVITDTTQKALVKPKRAKVIGVWVEDRADGEPGLLALEDDLRTVTHNGPNRRKKIFYAHAPVEHIAFCQRAPFIAYSTVDGEVVIYSVRHGADVCRYLPEGEK
jgi:hypothetical protein